MFDSNMKPWLLEINDTPSLVISLKVDKSNGEHVNVLSEIDKYVKMAVVEDAIHIVGQRHRVR